MKLELGFRLVNPDLSNWTFRINLHLQRQLKNLSQEGYLCL